MTNDADFRSAVIHETSAFELSNRFNRIQNKMQKYKDMVERVEALHERVQGPHDNWVCNECTSHAFAFAPTDRQDEAYIEWPCDTIKDIHIEEYEPAE